MPGRAPGNPKTQAKAVPVQQAVLGAQTRAFTRAEAKAYSLPGPGRMAVARLITAVQKGGPADKAGIRSGDAILAMDANRFHSGDSLLDFLAVTPPGRTVAVKLRRAKTFEDEVVKVELGARKVNLTGIRWQYAGLEQLKAALAMAKKQNKRLLVGISGAET